MDNVGQLDLGKTVWRRLTYQERLLALSAVAALTALFALARMLVPDPRGFGTHEQLGLSACLSMYLFGVPCPACGMTTAFALMARGRLVEGFAAQPAGALIFVVCGAAWFAGLGAAWTGRWVDYAPSRAVTRAMWAMVVTVFVGAWVYKIARSG